MWEVVSYGERPYWDMSNQDVSQHKSLTSKRISIAWKLMEGVSCLSLGPAESFSGLLWLWFPAWHVGLGPVLLSLSPHCRCWLQLRAYVLVFTTLFTALACPPPYKSIPQSLPPHTHKGILRIGFFSPSSLRALVPVGYLHCTDIVTAAVSSQERKNKSLGSSSLNKVLKQCVHLHFTLWGISALYWASKKRLITLIPIKRRRKKRIRNEKWQ